MSKAVVARNKLGSLVSDAVQKGVMIAMADKDEGQPGAIHLGCNTALCALLPVVPFFVKKPDMTKEEAKKNPNKLLQMINTETILFAALIAARMHGGVTAAGEIEDVDGIDASGLTVTGEVEFGPHVLHLAIEDWKKVTGKKPEDYFRPDLLAAIAESERDSMAPLDEFLKKRMAAQGSPPTSGTLQ